VLGFSRGIVLTVSTSVSKTESPGSNPGAPAIVCFLRAVLWRFERDDKSIAKGWGCV
jgi:hypothetical protein